MEIRTILSQQNDVFIDVSMASLNIGRCGVTGQYSPIVGWTRPATDFLFIAVSP